MFKKMEKIDFKSLVKEWKFWLKLISGLLILISLTYNLIVMYMNPGEAWILSRETNGKIYPVTDYMGMTVNYFSYFTTQSNLIVAIWFIYAAFRHDQEGNKYLLSKNFVIMISTYITVTMLIFNGMLLPELFINTPKDSAGYPGNWTAIAWYNQMILHTIGPILMILYAILFLNESETTDAKTFFKKQSWKALLYPLVYGIYILIRAEIRLGSGFVDSTAYPYFFFDLRHNVLWFFIAVFAIAAMSIGFSMLYNWLINVRIKKQK